MLLRFAGQQKTRNALIHAGLVDFLGLPETNNWCPEPESNRYAGFTQATDFKSARLNRVYLFINALCHPQ